MKPLIVLTAVTVAGLLSPPTSLGDPDNESFKPNGEMHFDTSGGRSVNVWVTERENLVEKSGLQGGFGSTGSGGSVGTSVVPVVSAFDQCVGALEGIDFISSSIEAEAYRRCWNLQVKPSGGNNDGANNDGGVSDEKAQDIVRSELGSLRVDSAGLVIQPVGRAFVGLPQLAHASTPEHVRTLTLLDHEVEAHFVASEFTFDFMDGSAPIVTSNPGGPWPDTSIQHTYDRPNPLQTVSLSVSWDVSVTNPYTGHVITLPRMLTSREVSESFDLRKPRSVNTDHAEIEQGH